MHHARKVAEIPDDQPNCLDEEIPEVLPVVMRKRPHRGSNLRDFLRDEGLLEEANAEALRRADGLQLARLSQLEGKNCDFRQVHRRK
jgi:hypothetical protein